MTVQDVVWPSGWLTPLPRRVRCYLQPCPEFPLLMSFLRPFGTQPLDHGCKLATARVSYVRVRIDSLAC
jgi:hypothetical protein